MSHHHEIAGLMIKLMHDYTTTSEQRNKATEFYKQLDKETQGKPDHKEQLYLRMSDAVKKGIVEKKWPWTEEAKDGNAKSRKQKAS